MNKLTMAALAATTAFTSLPAVAATPVDFIINTALAGQNVPGSPATITGTFDYDLIGAQQTSAVQNFSVLINGQAYNVFPEGVNSLLSSFNGSTGTLDFTSGNQTVFSFAIANFVTGPNGRPPASATTVTNATSFTYSDGTQVTIDAGLAGTIAVTNAVPEPGTWALMILGFGAVGASLRRRARAGVTMRSNISFA